MGGTMGIEYGLLGPLEARRDGKAFELPAGKPRSLLALLLLHAGDVVATDAVVEALWPTGAPASAPNAVQQYVAQLRRVLGRDAVVTRAPGYLLPLTGAFTDVAHAERLGAEGRTALDECRYDEAAALLRDALGLFRGAPLADFRYDQFARAEADRLEELRAALVESRIDADLELGRHRDLVGELEALVAEHPLRERPRAQLMLALYRSGRQADALAAFQEVRRVLVEELGVEPGDELQELHRRILNQDQGLGLDPADVAPILAPPVPPTRLVGRERELAEADAILARADVRLLTLTGPGGTGKTRLALALAARAAERYADGACFVPLAGLSDAELVPAELARALGLREAPGSDVSETVLRDLAGRDLLLVVDNLEQLLPAAPFLAELVAGAPRLDVVATSRAPLRLRAEHEYAVPPLAEGEAAELFLERARAVRSDLDADAHVDADAVLELVRRLDGLPLALELAAARLRLLDLRAIVDRLGHALTLLTGGARDVPERQRTLRAAIAWSEELLEPEERELFRRLSAFAGAFELESAERVCAADLDVLAALVDHALLGRAAGGGRPRFRMLFVIREYAAERLEASGEAESVRRAHAEWAAAFAREANPELAGARQAEWLERLTLAHDDFRAALTWAFEADPPVALRLAGQLDRFWRIQGHMREATDALERALASADGDPADRASALSVLGVISGDRGDVERAARAHEDALALRRTLGDPSLVAISLNNVGTIAHASGDHARAAELYEESLHLHEEAGQTRGVAIALNNLGDIAREAGDTVRALELQERSVELCRELDDAWLLALAVSSLAQTLVAVDPARAADLVAESLGLASALGNRARLANCAEILAAIAARVGDAERAALLLGKSAALRAELAIELETDQLEDHAATVERVRGTVGVERFAELELEGSGLPDEALALYAAAVNPRVGAES